MNNDLLCLRLVELEPEQIKDVTNGILLVHGDLYADSGCWSALGKAPGFEGNLKYGVSLTSLIPEGNQ